MDEKQRFILGAAVIVFVIFMAFSFKSNISPYVTVTHVVESGQLDNVQVNGTIVPGSTKHYPDNNTRFFDLTDGKNKMRVKFTGVLTNYQEGIPAVVIGDYSNGLFIADKVLLKCPSKYESLEENYSSSGLEAKV